MFCKKAWWSLWTVAVRRLTKNLKKRIPFQIKMPPWQWHLISDLHNPMRSSLGWMWTTWKGCWGVYKWEQRYFNNHTPYFIQSAVTLAPITVVTFIQTVTTNPSMPLTYQPQIWDHICPGPGLTSETTSVQFPDLRPHQSRSRSSIWDHITPGPRSETTSVQVQVRHLRPHLYRSQTWDHICLGPISETPSVRVIDLRPHQSRFRIHFLSIQNFVSHAELVLLRVVAVLLLTVTTFRVQSHDANTVFFCCRSMSSMSSILMI